MTYIDQWLETREVLSNRVDASIYKQHLSEATAVGYQDSLLTIKPNKPHSAGWLKLRLDETIRSTAAVVFGNEAIQIAYIGPNGQAADLPHSTPIDLDEPPAPNGHETHKAELNGSGNHAGVLVTDSGFTSLKSNFTTVPNGFFDQLIADPAINSVTIRLIAAVIRYTIGVIDTKGNRREWWENLTVPDICTASGIKSRNSVRRAQVEGINSGWLKYRRSTERPNQALDLAIRYEGEPVQHVDEKGAFFDG